MQQENVIHTSTLPTTTGRPFISKDIPSLVKGHWALWVTLPSQRPLRKKNMTSGPMHCLMGPGPRHATFLVYLMVIALIMIRNMRR